MLSAVEGIGIVAPQAYDDAMPITLAILFLLFMVQRFGTERVSFLFSPVIVIWFISLFGIGIYNITFDYTVLRAFSPSYGFQFFIRNGYNSWVQLGAVVLCITGMEALYADMSHFSANAVRISFISCAYPALLAAYCGQAAVLVADPSAISNSFYRSVPTPLFYPILVLATLATIIASQAMISAAFSLVMQAMSLQCFPRVTIIHTGKHHAGQVYIPEINYFMMVCCLGVTIGFGHSSSLVVAYGIAVTVVMFVNTVFFSAAIFFVFHKPWWLGLIFGVFYSVIDWAFISANLLKFVEGGWFPLLLSAILATVMLTWRWGRQAIAERMALTALSDDKLTFLRPRAPFANSKGSIEPEDIMREAEAAASMEALDAAAAPADLTDAKVSTAAATSPTESGRQTPQRRASPSLPRSPSSASSHSGDHGEKEKDVEKGERAGDDRASNGSGEDGHHGKSDVASPKPKMPLLLRRLTWAPGTAALLLPSATEPMPLVPGVFICFSSTSRLVPVAFAHLIRRIPFRPQLLVFVTVVSVNLSRVEDDLTITPIGDLEGVYRAVITVGYAQPFPDSGRLVVRILRHIRYRPPVLDDLRRASVATGLDGGHRGGNDSLSASAHAAAAAAAAANGEYGSFDDLVEWATEDAYVAAADPTLLMGRDAVVCRPNAPWFHRVRVTLFAGINRISRAQGVVLKIPTTNLLEIGMRVEI